MAEQSYIFDFSRVPTFFENFNINFKLSQMWNVSDIDDEGNYSYSNTSANNFELVLVSYGGDNIEDYLASDGKLNSNVEILQTQQCGLDWIKDEFGDGRIELHNAVTFNIGDTNVPLKAVFLRNKSSKYVMGYSINLVSFTVTNKVVFDEDVIFWDITRINNNG